MSTPTRFTDPHAVDVWDASFRWRSGDLLRDRTIDATWQRVAGALAANDGARGELWRRRYIEVFSRWQLLPDERLLRHAGTGRLPAALPEPQACLNLGAFVLAPRSATARFDHAGFAAAASLSVRLLDDALRLCEGEHASAGAAELAIGVMGLADALAALGLDYRGREAQLAAAAIARTLAYAVLEGALQLAQERGPGRDDADGALAAHWRDRALPPELAEPLRRHRRHRRLTRISVQPCLALLANNASIGLAAHRARGGRPALSAEAALSAQRALAAAMQPWIDAPVEIARGDCEDRLCSGCG